MLQLHAMLGEAEREADENRRVVRQKRLKALLNAP
jgi:hypothetical protein